MVSVPPRPYFRFLIFLVRESSFACCCAAWFATVTTTFEDTVLVRDEEYNPWVQTYHQTKTIALSLVLVVSNWLVQPCRGRRPFFFTPKFPPVHKMCSSCEIRVSLRRHTTVGRVLLRSSCSRSPKVVLVAIHREQTWTGTKRRPLDRLHLAPGTGRRTERKFRRVDQLSAHCFIITRCRRRTA